MTIAVTAATPIPSVSPAKSTTPPTASAAESGATSTAAVAPPAAAAIAAQTGSNGKNAGVAVPPVSVGISSPPGRRTNGPVSCHPTLGKSAPAASGGKSDARLSGTVKLPVRARWTPAFTYIVESEAAITVS
jgi:hypothetical protein